MTRGRIVIQDARLARWGGYAALVAGSWLLWQAYEARGHSRPWAVKLLPGP